MSDQTATERLYLINNNIDQLQTECWTINTRTNSEDEDNETDEECNARVSFSGSWANDKAIDVQWASSMESKRYPIVVFNYKILSESDSNPVGYRYHLTYKLHNCEARILRKDFLRILNQADIGVLMSNNAYLLEGWPPKDFSLAMNPCLDVDGAFSRS